MKSITDHNKRRSGMNRKGVFGLDSTKAFFTVLLGLALLSFVIVIIMGTLLDTNILTSGSAADNHSQDILNNVSAGVSGFFDDLAPVYTVLAVVIIILVLVVLVRIVSPSSGNKGGL